MRIGTLHINHFNHPARKFKFADTESNVVLVETNLGKTTFWTYILPE